ncbi:MAG: glycosyltransferase, partial [Methanoregula sp.]
LIIVDPGHPEQQNNAKKIVDMGAGIVVDGRTVTLDLLEQKIKETLALTPHIQGCDLASINGTKNAAMIIGSVGKTRI